MKVAVVGAGAAGMVFATLLKKRRPDWEIKVFEQGKYAGWAGCPLPYFIAGKLPFSNSVKYSVEHFWKERGLEVYINHKVTQIDIKNKRLYVEKIGPFEKDLTGWVNYDILFVATGSAVPIPGGLRDLLKQKNAFTFRNPQDALSLDKFIKERGPRKAAIIGAGFIGLELAWALAERGLKVEIFEKLKRPLSFLPDKHYSKIAKAVLQQGVELRTGIEFKGDEPFDLIVFATGAVPDVSLLKDAGVETITSDGVEGVKVDSKMKTSAEDVFAAGDVVLKFHKLKKKYVNLPLGDIADKQALTVVLNLSGANLKFEGVIGTFISHAFGLSFGKAGLGFDELPESAEIAWVRGSAGAGEFGRGAEADFAVFYDKYSGRILGVTAIGGRCLAQFLDVFSVLIGKGATIEEAFYMDYAYCPATSTVWNPTVALLRKVYE